MVSVNKLAAGAIVLFAAIPAHAAAPASKEPASGKMFCCEGGRICGDTFPQNCRGKAYSILDAKGNLIREEPAPLTPQQKADASARLLSGSYLLMLEERTDRLALAKCA